MCKPFKEYLGVVREYTRELVTFGGFAIALMVYVDFRELVQTTAENNAKTAEILRSMDERLSRLEQQRKED